ncbi:ester cyclase [Sphingobacterium sp. Mn56C]|uniref:ester cyclase n=1 Tax=Sphingobacterium sp. Mn56C TaxID=3395261 RepID=UPI003BBD8736
MKIFSKAHRHLSVLMTIFVSISLMSFKGVGEKKKTNREVVVEWYKNVDAGNYQELRKLMDKKYSFTNSMSHIPADGNSHIAMLTMFSSAFSEMKHTFTHFVNDGEWIAVYGTVTGKHAGDFNGLLPTNRHISNTWMHLFHIVDGKVVDAYFEMNPANIVSQVNE